MEAALVLLFRLCSRKLNYTSSHAHEVVDTSYPRFIPKTGLASAAPAPAAATPAPVAGAAAAAAAAAAAESTTATAASTDAAADEAQQAAAVAPGFSHVLEDPDYVFMPGGNSRVCLNKTRVFNVCLPNTNESEEALGEE